MEELPFSIEVTTAPAAAVLSTANAKAHLRVNISDDDTYIDTLVAVATKHAENVTGIRCISQVLTMRMDRFPCSAPFANSFIRIPFGPVSAIGSVKYIDTEGTEQTISSSDYVLDQYSLMARLYPAYSLYWPTPRNEPNAVRVQFTAGYADAATFAAAKPNILHAIKLIVGHYYEQREPVVIGQTVAQLPMAVEALLNAERVTWL